MLLCAHVVDQPIFANNSSCCDFAEETCVIVEIGCFTGVALPKARKLFDSPSSPESQVVSTSRLFEPSVLDEVDDPHHI